MNRRKEARKEEPFMLSEAGLSFYNDNESKLPHKVLYRRNWIPNNPNSGRSGLNGSKAIASQRASTKKDYKIQINTMVYAMGGNANEILKSFHLSERSLTNDRIKSRFETQLWALRILF